MKREEKNSNSIMKIICVSLILIFLSGLGVMAVTTQIDNVTITLADGYEMTVLTSKTKVSEILKDNNIVLTEEEKVTPNLNEEITESKRIKISNKSEKEIQIAKVTEGGTQTSLDEILKNYAPVTEKIVTEEVSIPFETVTKDTSDGSEDTTNRVLREGEDGIKLITYKVKYQNDIEIEKTVLSEEITKEPIDKIIQVQKHATSRSSLSVDRTANTSNSGTKYYKVTAYCSCSKCCGKKTGRTASGTKATAGRTVAASAQFKFGTKLKINGKKYVVEDRGGAVKGNKIDVYMNSHAAALAWGVKYLPVEIVD